MEAEVPNRRRGGGGEKADRLRGVPADEEVGDHPVPPIVNAGKRKAGEADGPKAGAAVPMAGRGGVDVDALQEMFVPRRRHLREPMEVFEGFDHVGVSFGARPEGRFYQPRPILVLPRKVGIAVVDGMVIRDVPSVLDAIGGLTCKVPPSAEVKGGPLQLGGDLVDAPRAGVTRSATVLPPLRYFPVRLFAMPWISWRPDGANVLPMAGENQEFRA